MATSVADVSLHLASIANCGQLAAAGPTPGSSTNAFFPGQRLRSRRNKSTQLFGKTEQRQGFLTSLTATAVARPQQKSAPLTERPKLDDGRIIKIHSRRGFDNALARAGEKLVVVEFTGPKDKESVNIYPAMAEISRISMEAVFLQILEDESEETRDICKTYNVTKVPHFIFFKNGEIVYEEDAVNEDQLVGDILYYADNDAPVHQLHGMRDVEKFVQNYAKDDQLVVIDVNLKNCGPCAKVYPTVINLSRQLAGTVVFARMVGDENESCEEFLRRMQVKEVPTFLFIKDGKMCGQYVGSNRGALIGEVLRHQGVNCT